MVELEEYKLFAESTQKLADRRQAITQTYLTVNTGIFTVLAFLIKDAGLRGYVLGLVSVPLFLVGIAVCIVWHRMINLYKVTISWRHDRLIEMEQRISNSYRMYEREAQRFVAGTKTQFSFSRNELWLPRLFLLLYALYGLGLIVWLSYLGAETSSLSRETLQC